VYTHLCSLLTRSQNINCPVVLVTSYFITRRDNKPKEYIVRCLDTLVSSSPMRLPIRSPNLIGLCTHSSWILAHDKVRGAASQPPPASVIVDFCYAQPIDRHTAPRPHALQAGKDYDVLRETFCVQTEISSVVKELICKGSRGSTALTRVDMISDRSDMKARRCTTCRIGTHRPCSIRVGL